MELIKHIFGFCGEPHLNIITLIISTPIIIYLTHYINQLFK
jgi:hypothetical protein